MFDLFNRSQPRRPSAALARALASHDLAFAPGMDLSRLLVVAKGGSYSGRRVTYFRLFDPVHLSEQSVRVHTFADLDAYPAMVLAAGHLERDGTVSLPQRDRTDSANPFVRSRADRAAHADDEHFVFPPAGSAEAQE